MKRILSLLLVAMMAISAVACSGDSTDTKTTTADTTVSGETETAGTTETDRSTYADSLPELDFEGADVVIYSRSGTDYQPYEMGYDEAVGEIVADALYERNRYAEEKLNVKLDIQYGPENSTAYSNSYHNTILSSDHVYDIISAVQAAAIKFSHEGVFVNLSNAPYIDYDKPWWNVDYIDEISVSPETRYFLIGDISVFALRNLSAVFYNKTMYDSIYGDPDGLYEYILDGSWTYDEFLRIVEESYNDINGDGKADLGDTLGVIGNTGTTADHYSFTAGMQMNTRDAVGFPVLVDDQSNNVAVMEVLRTLYFNTPGFYLTSGGWSTEEPETRGKFIDGSTMFRADRLYNAEYFRDMDNEYGIVPFPKLNDAQDDYKALVHNSCLLYVLPITTPSLEMPCAVLEALAAEAYRTVTPAYYDVALKVKYSRDDMSGQVIDIIRDSMMTDFCYANSTSVNEIGTLARDLLGAGANFNYMSTYDAKLGAAQTALATMIENAAK